MIILKIDLIKIFEIKLFNDALCNYYNKQVTTAMKTCKSKKLYAR
jgi:hypothetical protein